MQVDDFIRGLFEITRFKNDKNLMDRKITVLIGDKECEMVNVSVDYIGDVVIEVEEA